MRIEFTHKGWMGLCPIYCNDPKEEDFRIVARHHWLDWWLDLNEMVLGALYGFHASAKMPFVVDEEPMAVPVVMYGPDGGCDES